MITFTINVQNDAGNVLLKKFHWPVLPRIGETIFLDNTSFVASCVEFVWHRCNDGPDPARIEVEMEIISDADFRILQSEGWIQ